MPKTRARTIACRGCGKQLPKRSSLKRLTSDDLIIMSPTFKTKLKAGDYICNNCFCTPIKSSTALDTQSSSDLSNSHIMLSIPKATSSTTCCIVCQKDRRTNSRVAFKQLLPSSRAKIFVETGIYVADKAWACSTHFINNDLLRDCYSSVKSATDTFLAGSDEITSLLSEVRKIAKQDGYHLNFDDPQAKSDEDYVRLMGITLAPTYILRKVIITPFKEGLSPCTKAGPWLNP